MNKPQETAQKLLDFIDRSPSCFHVIGNIKKELEEYSELKENEKWELYPGGKFYVTRNSSSLIAFRIPALYERKPGSYLNGFRICAAHSDSPTFRIKPNAEINVDSMYRVLNVEKYGGMLMSTWMDRPLSVAGRVFVDVGGNVEEKRVNIDRELLVIPCVAIHMNRDANDGFKLDPAKDMRPVFASGGSQDDEAKVIELIADDLGVDEESILGADLCLYNRVKGTFIGAYNEMIASRSLDDLQCVFGLVKGFTESEDEETSGIPVACVFDNEEVGSLTKQGADSTFLRDVLERIASAIEDDLSSVLADSFMISADNAHAVHPNHPEYADPTNRPELNKGIVIKYNANQKYTTDAHSEAVLKKLCKDADIPVQTYANRSDIAGGSTLGNLSNRHVSVSTVDIGLPQLAMHSSYETAGTYDTQYLIELIKKFYGK